MGWVSEGTKAEKFTFILEWKTAFGIRYLCKRLHVTYQGYYQWLKRGLSAHAEENIRLKKRIIQLYRANDGNYGYPRIHAALVQEGELVNHKRVARLMKEIGLVGKAGQLYRRKALPENTCIKVPNQQRERGMPNQPNQQWAGDVSYLKVQGKWQYLAVIIDLYSRKVVGWSLSEAKTVALTLSALDKAVRSRKLKKGMLFHSDRGSEYGAHAYQNKLKAFGITPSMNRPGYMNDNIYVETFFQSLKTESFKGICFDSVSSLKSRLSWYIDKYYNQKRLHGSLNFKSPCDYERMAA